MGATCNQHGRPIESAQATGKGAQVRAPPPSSLSRLTPQSLLATVRLVAEPHEVLTVLARAMKDCRADLLEICQFRLGPAHGVVVGLPRLELRAGVDDAASDRVERLVAGGRGGCPGHREQCRGGGDK